MVADYPGKAIICHILWERVRLLKAYLENGFVQKYVLDL
jgi:hypothetical protein